MEPITNYMEETLEQLDNTNTILLSPLNVLYNLHILDAVNKLNKLLNNRFNILPNATESNLMQLTIIPIKSVMNLNNTNKLYDEVKINVLPPTGINKLYLFEIYPIKNGIPYSNKDIGYYTYNYDNLFDEIPNNIIETYITINEHELISELIRLIIYPYMSRSDFTIIYIKNFYKKNL